MMGSFGLLGLVSLITSKAIDRLVNGLVCILSKGERCNEIGYVRVASEWTSFLVI